MTEQQARKFVADRSGGRCEICRGPGPLTFSHRRPSSLGGLWVASNGIRACGSGTTGCHGWIEHHPDWAEVAGYRVAKGMDPVDVPVWVNPVLAWPGWVLLDNTGGYIYPEAQPPAPPHLPPQAA